MDLRRNVAHRGWSVEEYFRQLDSSGFSTAHEYGQRVLVFSLECSCRKRSKDSEDIEDKLLALVDSFAHVYVRCIRMRCWWTDRKV